jgi:hypothetical protein
VATYVATPPNQPQGFKIVTVISGDVAVSPQITFTILKTLKI